MVLQWVGTLTAPWWTRVVSERDRKFLRLCGTIRPLTGASFRYHLMMIFGGAELLMELMDLITDQPEFDATWLDFCKLYNGTDAQ